MIPYDDSRVIPSTADAPTLTLAAAVLLASMYPRGMTPDQGTVLGMQAVDTVFSMWNEIMRRIAAGPTP